jgi:hypothetical protein
LVCFCGARQTTTDSTYELLGIGGQATLVDFVGQAQQISNANDKRQMDSSRTRLMCSLSIFLVDNRLDLGANPVPHQLLDASSIAPNLSNLVRFARFSGVIIHRSPRLVTLVLSSIQLWQKPTPETANYRD